MTINLTDPANQLTNERLAEIAVDGFLEHGDAKEMARELQERRKSDALPATQPSRMSGIMPDYEGVAMTQRECYMAGKEAGLAEARKSPVITDGWKLEAERLAEIHGCSFVVFRHGDEPQCVDPAKVIISFTDKGLGHTDSVNLRENSNSSTKHFRENPEASTNCPKCGGSGTYHCPQMLGTVECECTLPAAPQEVE